MRKLDILFLSYILVWFFDLKEIHTVYAEFIFLIIQIALSFKYKLGARRWQIIVLIIIGVGGHLLVILIPGMTDIHFLLTVLSMLSYLSAFLIYVYNFIIKPLLKSK